MSTGLGLIAVLVLVLLNGFFVAAEFALVSVRRSRVAQLANEGNTRARRVQQALSHLDTYIAATQLGITMASLALGFIGEAAIAPLLQPLLGAVLPHGRDATLTAEGVALALAFVIATTLHIVIGELAPKSIALQRTDITALWVTGPLNLFLTLFRPFIFVLNGIGNAVVRAMGLEPAGEHAAVHSVEELELLVHSTREAGLLEEDQERMVAGVFDFGTRRVSRVMTPRTELDAVEVTLPWPDVVRRAAMSRHHRLPVYAQDPDHILGVIQAKDVLRVLADPQTRTVPVDLRALLRPVPFVPESLPLDDLLVTLRRERVQVAIVLDEFGGTAGLVTLEDVLEEIAGEVREADTPGAAVEILPDGSLVLDGLLPIDTVNERAGLGIVDPFYDTLGGYVLGRLGRAPAVGDEIVLPDGRCLQVTELDGQRVARVRLVPVDGDQRAYPPASV